MLQRRLRQNLCFITLLTIFFILNNPAAWSEEGDETEYELPEVSVTATRSERKMDKLPRNVTVITSEEIERMNPAVVTDVLKGVPGLVVRDISGSGSMATVDMRGFGETGPLNTVVTVDGRRLNQIDLSGVDWTTIPVDNIERIEILHGAAGVLYGDKANGGAINIVTKRGKDGFKGRVKAQYGTYETEGVSVMLQGGYEKFDIYAAGSYDYTDGYRDNSYARKKNASFNAGVYPSERVSFLVEGIFNKSKYGAPGSLTTQQAKEDPTQTLRPNDWYEAEDQTLRAMAKFDFKAYGEFSIDFAVRERQSGSEIFLELDSDIDTYSILPKYVLDGKIGSVSHRFTAGLDYYSTDAKNTWKNVVVGGPNTLRSVSDIELKSSAWYLLEEIDITDKITFSAGYRQQISHELKYKDNVVSGFTTGLFEGSHEEKESAWSLGLTYNFKPGSKVYARAARSYRYPVIDEHYNTWTGQFTYIKPQTMLTYEIGGEWTFMPGGKVSLSVYTMDVTDEIGFVAYRSFGAGANENIGDARHSGFEAGLRLPLGRKASLFGSYSYQDAHFTSGEFEDKRVPLVPYNKWTIGTTVSFTDALKATVQANHVGPRWYGSDYRNEYDRLDDYTTVDLSISYKWNRYNFFLNGKNILGEEYSSFGFDNRGVGPWGTQSIYPAPTYEWLLGMSVDF